MRPRAATPPRSRPQPAQPGEDGYEPYPPTQPYNGHSAEPYAGEPAPAYPAEPSYPSEPASYPEELRGSAFQVTTQDINPSTWLTTLEGQVVDQYNNPRNVGSFAKDTAGVGTGLVGAPECGDVMKLQIKVNVETGVIEDAKFKTFGCGSAIASSSLATEWLKGKSVEEAMAIRNTQIVEELALPPVKVHCSVLAEDAIKAAIKNYQEKQEKAEEESEAQAEPAAV